MSLPLPAALLPALLLALVSTPAAADGPQDLDSADGAMPIGTALPPSAAGLVATDRPQHLGEKILFVNFDGADMNACGNNDPHNNCSTIFNGTVLPFTGDAVRRASIVQVLRKRMQDYGVTVTDQRPQSGDYDMEMVGDWQNSNPDFAGVAPNIDCFDATGGETSFTLEVTGSTDGIAEIVLQELAHTWGLEHIDNQADLLYPTTQGSNKTFRDECIKIVADTDLNPSNGWCNSVHTNFCSSGWQNSHQEMLFLFGPSVPDTLAPTVAIVSPENGAEIPGGNLELVIELADDQTPAVIGAEILLTSDALSEPVETGGAYAAPGSLTFPIDGLPDGSYTVRVDVQDESDNPSSDEISFVVVGNPPSGGDDGGGNEGGSGGGEGGQDGSGGGDEGMDGSGGSNGSDPGIGGSDPTSAEGCECRASADDHNAPAGLLALWGMFLLVGRRRRQ